MPRLYASLLNGFHHCDYFLRYGTKVSCLNDVLSYVSSAARNLVVEGSEKNRVDSAESVARLLSIAGMLEAEIRFVVEKISQDWNLLRPRTKLYVKNIADEFEVTAIKELPQPTGGQLRIAEVPWTIADALFFAEKDTYIGMLAKDDIILTASQPRQINVITIKNILIPMLGAIVKLRAEIDVSLIATNYSSIRTELLDYVHHRVQEEFYVVLKEFDEYINRYENLYNMSSGFRSVVDMDWRQSFIDEYHMLQSNMNKVKPQPRWINEINSLAGEQTMTKYEIHGSQVLIAETGAVATQINAALQNQPGKETLSEIFALLRAEVLGSASLTDVKRKQAINAIESAELEAAERSPDKSSLTRYLTIVRDAMKAGGEVFDQAAGWGGRLLKLASILGISLA